MAVVELIFDPHIQTRKSVTDFAVAAGFLEKDFWGNWMAYVINFQKPFGEVL